MRRFGEMTEEEQALYRIYEGRLNNDLCTPQEKADARHQMDALQWAGPTGPIMAKLGALEKRIEALESGGGSKSSAKLSKKAEADLVAYVIDEAKTAVAAEAASAAKEQVSALLGDNFGQ